jgi:hypothetical protein
MSNKMSASYFASKTPSWTKEIITVDQAKFILENLNKNNRPFSEANIKSLVEAIRKNRWVVSEKETIGFTPSGQLGDGQHRLKAQVRVNKDLEYWVLRGYNSAHIPISGSGKPRSVSDDLHIDGFTNTNVRAAFARAWVRDGTSRHVPKQDVKDQHLAIPEDIMTAYVTIKSKVKRGRLSCADIYAAFAKIEHSTSSTKAKRIREAAERLATGENLVKNTPVHSFREFIIDHKNRNIPAHQLFAIAKYIAECVRDDKKLSRNILDEYVKSLTEL